jgi:ABC-type glycerol-3-phosphate transport system substrate-binding protein
MRANTPAMPGEKPVWTATLPAILLFLAGAVIVACAPGGNEAPLPTPTYLPPTATPIPPAILPTETATPTTIPPTSGITLTLWTTEAFSPTDVITSGQVLAKQLGGFEAARDNITVKIVLKKPYGDGGMLSFLRTARAAAPSVLPDAAILDAAELQQAARLGLVQPLEDVVAPSSYENLYPFAEKVSQYEGHVMGIPFTTNIEHFVYNTGILTNTPLLWSDVLSGNAKYIFPAGGDGGLVNDAFLVQYFALGGRFSDPDGKPVLDKGVVREVLSYYEIGRESGVFPPTILKFQTPDDCWSIYTTGQAAMSHVSSKRFLADRDMLQSTDFTPIPTEDGAVVTVAHTWVFVLVTEDPARQQVAARLLEWLLDPERSAAWNLAAGTTPPSRDSMAVLINTGDSYFVFLEGQLAGARPYPDNPKYPEIARALQKAVEEVLTNTASAEEATEEVITGVGLE